MNYSARRLLSKLFLVLNEAVSWSEFLSAATHCYCRDTLIQTLSILLGQWALFNLVVNTSLLISFLALSISIQRMENSKRPAPNLLLQYLLLTVWT